MSSKRKRVLEYFIDETMLEIGSKFALLWLAMEPKNKKILTLNMSKEHINLKDLLTAQSVFMESILFQQTEELGIPSLQVPETQSPSLFLYDKSLEERTMQYIKDRAENFDDDFPYRKKICNLNNPKNCYSFLYVIIILN